MHQLACTPFHIFGRCTVIKDYECVCALETKSHELQKHFHLVLLACYHVHSWIIFTNSAVGLVVCECRADENNVVELKAKRAVELVHHKT